MSDDMAIKTLHIPVPKEALPTLTECDMPVVPGTPEQIEFARQAAAQVVCDWHGQNGNQTPMPEALGYLIAFLNRAIHVEKEPRGTMQ